jgi:hypothetical protein
MIILVECFDFNERFPVGGRWHIARGKSDELKLRSGNAGILYYLQAENLPWKRENQCEIEFYRRCLWIFFRNTSFMEIRNVFRAWTRESSPRIYDLRFTNDTAFAAVPGHLPQ